MLTPSSFHRGARVAFLAWLVFALAGCAETAALFQGFNARLASAYSTVTYARDTAGALLDAGVIEPDEAENVQAQADHFRIALDQVRVIHTRDPATASEKLAATVTALQGLRGYLERLEPKEPDDGE